MGTLKIILISVLGGIVGAFLYTQVPVALKLGATVARTTITNPWTFATSTTFSKTVTVTQSNTATSTVSAGCFQFYATSSATALKFQASTTPGIMYSQFGRCPNL